MADAPTIHYNANMEPEFTLDPATAISNLVRETEEEIQTGERDELIGEADTTQAVIFSDLGVQVSVSGTMLTGYALPAIGAAQTAGGVSGYVMDASIQRTRNLNKVRLMVEKPDAITAIS